MKIDFKKIAQRAMHVAEDKKGVDPKLLDIRRTSDVADFVMIVTVESSAQMRAMADGIEEALKADGSRLLRRDGRHGNRWMALDYGGLVVHVLTTEAREFYRLEQLWDEAKAVVSTPAKPAKAAPRRVIHAPRPKARDRRKKR